MRSEPARLGGISLDFTGIPPRRDENFPYEHAGGPARWGEIEFSLISFVLFFKCYLNNIRTFVLHDGFAPLFIWLNNLFNKLFDWTEIEDSIWTWDKNHLT